MYELLGMIKDGKASDITTNFMFDRKKYNLLAFLDEYTLDINSLNWEVEIIGEEKKIPEKLDIYDELQSLLKDNNIDEHNLHKMLKKIELKQNEIIDYLKSKGDE